MAGAGPLTHAPGAYRPAIADSNPLPLIWGFANKLAVGARSNCGRLPVVGFQTGAQTARPPQFLHHAGQHPRRARILAEQASKGKVESPGELPEWPNGFAC